MKKILALRTIILILFLTNIIFFTACSPATKKPPAKRTPRVTTKQESPKETSREIVRPRVQFEPPAMTPQKRASNRLVERGKSELDLKNNDVALSIFQDAANVDPSNGEAYYYLALVNFELGSKDAAVGLLDKAESLLRYDENWLEKIDELRSSITGEKPAMAPLPKFEDQY